MPWEIISDCKGTVSTCRQDYFFHCLPMMVASPYKLPHSVLCLVMHSWHLTVEEASLGWLLVTRGLV